MWFDSDFSFSKHFQNVCKCCFIQLRDFRNIRQFLTHDKAVSVANAFVSSWLDYCNSLFRSLSKFHIHRLQSILDSVARIVTNSSKYTRITPVHRKTPLAPCSVSSSNWLPWCTSVFILASLNILFHIYPHTTILTILDVISVVNFLNVPKFQPKIHKSTKQFGFSFAFDASTASPEDIRASPTVASFRKKLKTYLYPKAYPT